MLLLMLFLSVFPVGYAVLEITPSTICGPFRLVQQVVGHYELYSQTGDKVK